jgi:hypothetical protein
MLIVLSGIGILVWHSFSREEMEVAPSTGERSFSPQEMESAKKSVGEIANPVVDSDEALMERSTPMVLASPNFSLDGDVEEWRSISPTLSLVKTDPRAQDGIIWVSQTDQGLLIAGDVLDDTPRWPKTASEIALGDHIEVWLADARELKFPPLWLSYCEITSEEDCDAIRTSMVKEAEERHKEECKQWFKKQVQYRETLRKLFLRQWQVVPGMVEETYATPAFDSFDDKLKATLTPLRPSGKPQVRIKETSSEKNAYSFEILVPWNAFPPMGSLKLQYIKVLVDVFNSGTAEHQYGLFSSTSETRQYEIAESFHTLRLAEPRQYFITPCRYELKPTFMDADPDLRCRVNSEHVKGYFIPQTEMDIRTVLVVDDAITAYADIMPNYSPVVGTATYFARRLEPGEMLCGPPLVYLKDSRITRIEHGVSDQSLEVKRLPNGDRLAKSGPREYYSCSGAGQCGGCTRVRLDMYYIDHAGAISLIGEFDETASQPPWEIRITVSDDWKKITVFRLDDLPSRWSSTTFGYQERGYVMCDEQEPVPEPPKNLQSTHNSVSRLTKRRKPC